MSGPRDDGASKSGVGNGDTTLVEKGKADISSPAPPAAASAAHVWFCILYVPNVFHCCTISASPHSSQVLLCRLSVSHLPKQGSAKWIQSATIHDLIPIHRRPPPPQSHWHRRRVRSTLTEFRAFARVPLLACSYIPSIAFFPDFTFSYETFMRTRSLGFAYVLMVRVCSRSCCCLPGTHCCAGLHHECYNLQRQVRSQHSTPPSAPHCKQPHLTPPAIIHSLLLFQFLRALVIPFSIVISYYQFRTLPSFKAGNRLSASCRVFIHHHAQHE
jgi:hypothetical protein